MASFAIGLVEVFVVITASGRDDPLDLGEHLPA